MVLKKSTRRLAYPLIDVMVSKHEKILLDPPTTTNAFVKMIANYSEEIAQAALFETGLLPLRWLTKMFAWGI